MSQIAITGIRGFGHHGVLDDERASGQEFIVDLVMEVDTAQAEKSDDVRDTVHYGEVAELVHRMIGGEPVNLIETLAGRIANAVLDFAGVESVALTVHKPQAPIPVPFADVSVTVVRARGQS